MRNVRSSVLYTDCVVSIIKEEFWEKILLEYYLESNRIVHVSYDVSELNNIIL